MITGFVKSLAASKEPARKLFGLLYRSTIYRLDYTAELGIRGIYQDHAPIREDAGAETGEGGSHRLAWAVGITQDLGCFGVAKQSDGLFDYGIDLVIEANRTDRSPRYVLACCREDL